MLEIYITLHYPTEPSLKMFCQRNDRAAAHQSYKHLYFKNENKSFRQK